MLLAIDILILNEAKKERDPYIENLFGEVSEEVAEVREKLEGIKTRVFKRKKNKIMNALKEVEYHFEELSESMNSVFFHKKRKEALNSR